ncbi:PQQ-binding-like beta-propeller repeat protein [Halorarum halophilum]|uniref:PQQ-binding-like beta-propeller repeat protein n=1 Tax=Halorarum halophilum TaxID=2743090 RepID=A0A7D5KDQ3_9EURY|nr:PQQ-binding-like beta-propeller repeat protein [Halobaculum halophilum]QLG26316.1 PQQ-binding-like beta-propeller repeat protein [Halobaculum halophilum]
MVPQRLTRRASLALTGGALTTGCLARVPGGFDDTNETDDTIGTPNSSGASEGSWPMLGRTAGHVGSTTAVTGAEPTERWHVEVDGPVTTPTVVDGTVYVARGKPTDGPPRATVEAYALDTGERRWSLPLSRDGEPVEFAFSAPNSNRRPVYYRGRLFASVGQSIAAIDPAGPEQLWTTDPVENVHFNEPPTVTESGVYAGGPFGLVAFDHDGSRRWAFPESATDDDHMNDPFGSPRVAAVTDDAVYVSMGKALLELDPSDATERWRREDDGPSTSTVVLAGDTLVRVGFDGVEAVGTDGSQRWLADWPGKAVLRPAVAGDTVYVAGLTGHVAAYDLSNGGERLWHVRLAPDRFAQGTVATVTERAVHVLRVDDEAREVRAVALDREDGSTTWELTRSGTRARGVVPAEGSYTFTTESTPEEERQQSTVGSGQDTTATLWAFDAE